MASEEYLLAALRQLELAIAEQEEEHMESRVDELPPESERLFESILADDPMEDGAEEEQAALAPQQVPRVPRPLSDMQAAALLQIARTLATELDGARRENRALHRQLAASAMDESIASAARAYHREARSARSEEQGARAQGHVLRRLLIESDAESAAQGAAEAEEAKAAASRPPRPAP